MSRRRQAGESATDRPRPAGRPTMRPPCLELLQVLERSWVGGRQGLRAQARKGLLGEVGRRHQGLFFWLLALASGFPSLPS
jgi:hypothetical protein